MRARAVHDRDGEGRRCRTAVDDVLEHDDVYQSGVSRIFCSDEMIEAPGECRPTMMSSAGWRRGWASHRGFDMTPREIIDWTLQKSGWGTLDNLEAQRG